MKKLMILLAACLPMFIFTACGDDDDNEKSPTIKNITADYYITADLATLEKFDVQMSYLDKGGNIQNEKVKSVIWTKHVENVNPSGMKCYLILRDSFKDSEKISVIVNGYIAIKIYWSNGQVSDIKQTTGWPEFSGMSKAKVEAKGSTYQEQIDKWNNVAKFALNIDKNGKVSDVSSSVWDK